jgi:hypothetical protein
MKFGTVLAALTLSIGAASFTALAQPGGGPPMPKPAAGALPNPNPNAVQRSFRTQSPDEQKTSTAAQPRDLGQSGRSRMAAQSDGPPMPKPAAGALPNPNPNAVQRSFRTQSKDEQQSSTAAQPRELGQSGRSRTGH